MTPAGTILAGRYRAGRTLGKGGMGVVLEATHLELGTSVAVKVLHEELARDPDYAKRFLREARAAAQLRGEHVCRVHDFGTSDDGLPFMVMEMLTGCDFATLLDQLGPQPAARASSYLLQVCTGVAEAHALGIVHRDLKPTNLFRTRRPDGAPLVKILDFGLAKSLNGADVSQTLSAPARGSPRYMSPEQLRDPKTADPRSDIWSLGVIIYELVAGRQPFEGKTMMELALTITNDPPAPMADTLPAGFARVVLRCLEKDPAKRFQSVADLAAALDPFAKSVTDEPVIDRAETSVDESPTEIPPGLDRTGGLQRALEALDSSPALVRTPGLDSALHALGADSSPTLDSAIAIGRAPSEEAGHERAMTDSTPTFDGAIAAEGTPALGRSLVAPRTPSTASTPAGGSAFAPLTDSAPTLDGGFSIERAASAVTPVVGRKPMADGDLLTDSAPTLEHQITTPFIEANLADRASPRAAGSSADGGASGADRAGSGADRAGDAGDRASRDVAAPPLSGRPRAKRVPGERLVSDRAIADRRWLFAGGIAVAVIFVALYLGLRGCGNERPPAATPTPSPTPVAPATNPAPARPATPDAPTTPPGDGPATGSSTSPPAAPEDAGAPADAPAAAAPDPGEKRPPSRRRRSTELGKGRR